MPATISPLQKPKQASRNLTQEIEHGTLVNLLRKKIKDERFINLIWKLLRAGYLDLRGAQRDSLAGHRSQLKL